LKRLVLVEWDDSNVIHGWRVDNGNMDEVAHCRTVGILVSESETSVTVAFGESDCHSVMETITIPKGCITAIRRLRVK